MAIWWIRRDLRLTDNLALQAALSEPAAPSFRFSCWTRTCWRSRPSAGRHFCLPACARWRKICALWARGCSSAAATLLKNCRAWRRSWADCLSSRRRTLPLCPRTRPFGRHPREDLKLLPSVGGQALGAVLKADGTPYTVFTPFSRAWKALAPAHPPPRKPLSSQRCPRRLPTTCQTCPPLPNSRRANRKPSAGWTRFWTDQFTPTRPSATGWTLMAPRALRVPAFRHAFRPAGRPGCARRVVNAPMESARRGRRPG